MFSTSEGVFGKAPVMQNMESRRKIRSREKKNNAFRNIDVWVGPETKLWQKSSFVGCDSAHNTDLYLL